MMKKQNIGVVVNNISTNGELTLSLFSNLEDNEIAP
jgi:hypothetical protein